MKRKEYEKPTINIVKLQQRGHLLAGSSLGGTLGSGWRDSGGDAWGGGGSSGGGGSLSGGWSDSGDDPWD